MTTFRHLLGVAFLSLFFSVAFSYADTATFRVGVIAPLTGALAEYGTATKNGIEIAKSESPADFENIEFVYEDSQWDAKTALSAFNRLKTSDNISLFYNWGNPTTEAIAPVAERSKTPLIALSMDPRVAVGKSYVVRTAPSSNLLVEPLVRYLKNHHYKRIGVVIAENTYVQTLYDGLTKGLGSENAIEIIERHPTSEQDFRSSLLKIRARNYDILGVFLISGQVGKFYRQMTEQGIKVPTFGADFFESSNEIKAAKGGMNRAIYPNMAVSDTFRDRYVARFGNDYQIAFAGNAHDMAVMIGKLFNSKNPNVTAEKVMNTIRQSGEFNGVSGTFRYRNDSTEGPYFDFPVGLKKIVGDNIQTASAD